MALNKKKGEGEKEMNTLCPSWVLNSKKECPVRKESSFTEGFTTTYKRGGSLAGETPLGVRLRNTGAMRRED